MTRETILRLPQPLRICAQLLWPTGLHRPHAAILDTLFVYCDPCGLELAATRHGGILRCAEGHQIRGAA